MAISPAQVLGLEIAERVTSVCSVVGAAFIISTFLTGRKFRKPINRLVFFAAWGNLFANVATLISRAGINLGPTSALCQFQAFLIHWFLAADALWIFAMACNVYLSFFHQYDASRLRGLEWKYLGLCYGVPFVPAFVFLFVSTGGRGRIYGDAELWCWISHRWSVLRIAAFYGPIWLVILVTMFIYIKVGVVVFRYRRQLVSLSQHSVGHMKTPPNPIPIKRDNVSTPTAAPLPQGRRFSAVTISSEVPHPAGDRKRRLSSLRDTPLFLTRLSSIQESSMPQTTPNAAANEKPLFKTVNANKATLSYCKTAMLFFIALLCTWVPSTVNRLYSLINPDASIYGLDLASGIVLPLQGFWNTMIYIMTSLEACKALWAEIKSARIFNPSRSNPGMSTGPVMGLPPPSQRALGSEDTRAEETFMPKELDEENCGDHGKEMTILKEFDSDEREFAVIEEEDVHQPEQHPYLDPVLDPNPVNAR